MTFILLTDLTANWLKFSMKTEGKMKLLIL
jgi:hypothetical protein